MDVCIHRSLRGVRCEHEGVHSKDVVSAMEIGYRLGDAFRRSIVACLSGSELEGERVFSLYSQARCCWDGVDMMSAEQFGSAWRVYVGELWSDLVQYGCSSPRVVSLGYWLMACCM